MKLVQAIGLAHLGALLPAAPPQPACPPTPWAVTESTDTEAVVLLVEPTHHLVVERSSSPASRPIRPGRWKAAGAPEAPTDVTVVGALGQSAAGSLDAVEWLCVDPCAAGIPVCAWTARYLTAPRDWAAAAVVPGEITLQPVTAGGSERALSLEEVDPQAKTGRYEEIDRLDTEARRRFERYWADISGCTASAVGPFERVVCPGTNAAYLRVDGMIVERAWEDYGLVSLEVLGRSGEDASEAYLVRTSGKFSLSSSWVHRQGEGWHRDGGPSNRLGGKICDRGPEIAVLNPHTGRADPPQGDAARRLWYALVDKEGETSVVMARWDGEPLDGGWASGRIRLLVRGGSNLREGSLRTAHFDEACADIARGAPWGAERRACSLTHDELGAEQRFTLETSPARPPYALTPSGVPQLSLSIVREGPPRSAPLMLLTAPPEIVAEVRLLFAGDLTGDRNLDLVLEAPRVEKPEQRRVRLLESSHWGPGRWRFHEAAAYDVPLR